jgi:hypothetical protein
MFRVRGFIAPLCAALVLAGCGGRRTVAVTGAEGAGAGVGAADYLAPPTPLGIETKGEGLSLWGSAPAGGRARLATPDGKALFADVDPEGRWRLALGPLAAPQIYGLSATAKGRTVQAQGYILVGPRGPAALLRAGAAAWRIDRPEGSGLRSLDYDRAGGGAVSATVPIRATVRLELDGRQVAEGRADADGRFEVALPEPVRPGVHRLRLVGDGFTDSVTVQITPPLAQGPMRSQFTAASLRADWMTPGGGVQSTILFH